MSETAVNAAGGLNHASLWSLSVGDCCDVFYHPGLRLLHQLVVENVGRAGLAAREQNMDCIIAATICFMLGSDGPYVAATHGNRYITCIGRWPTKEEEIKYSVFGPDVTGELYLPKPAKIVPCEPPCPKDDETCAPVS